jgi:hypothetical protein
MFRLIGVFDMVLSTTGQELILVYLYPVADAGAAAIPAIPVNTVISVRSRLQHGL